MTIWSFLWNHKRLFTVPATFSYTQPGSTPLEPGRRAKIIKWSKGEIFVAPIPFWHFLYFTGVFFFPAVASNFSPFILCLLSDTRSCNVGVISHVFYLFCALPSTHFTSFFIFFFPVCLPNVYHSMPFPLNSSSFNNWSEIIKVTQQQNCSFLSGTFSTLDRIFHCYNMFIVFLQDEPTFVHWCFFFI